MRLSHESKTRLAVGGTAIALIAILVAALSSCQFRLLNNDTESTVAQWGDWDEAGIEYDGKATVLSKATFDAKDVQALDLDVDSGDVDVALIDGDAVTVVEKGRVAKGVEAKDAKVKGLIELDGSTLKVCKAKARDKQATDRTITIGLPRDLAARLMSVRVSAGSGDVSLTGVTCEVLDSSIGSGDFSFKGTAAKTLKAQIGSGDAEFVLDSAPSQSMDIQGGSGDAYVEVPHDAGFSAEVSLGSGDFSSDFLDDDLDGFEISSKTFKNGDGSATFRFNVGSGDMTLSAR